MARQAVSILAASLGFATILVAPAWAHHSHAAYEPVKMISVEGVVSEVRWTNPHMWIVVDVPGENGQIEKWGIEGSGTASTVSSGVSPQVLKVGAHVKILAHRSRDPQKHTALFMGMEVDGKVYARGGGTDIRGKEEY